MGERRATGGEYPERAGQYVCQVVPVNVIEISLKFGVSLMIKFEREDVFLDLTIFCKIVFLLYLLTLY